jgi:hypothetical protein
MDQMFNKHGPDLDVGAMTEIRPRDGTGGRKPRDGTKEMARDGTTEMPRDGTMRFPRDGTNRKPRDKTILLLGSSPSLKRRTQLQFKPAFRTGIGRTMPMKEYRILINEYRISNLRATITAIIAN